MDSTLPGWASLGELSQMVRAGTVSPTELVSMSYARISLLNPLVNAFVATCEERARAEASRAEARVRRGEARPLEGIPVAIKDNAAVEGMPVTEGSRSSSLEPAASDAEVVARLRRAGAIVVGKTNLPEFGSLPVTESELLGACRNPWDPSLTPGGSSGGSAAAVAAGMVPVAHGNDGGGSLRIPASCCGVLGLKPARGRISLSPSSDGSGLGLVTPGFLTTRTSDMALLLDLTSGPAPGDPYHAPPPRLPFSAALASDGPALRIGWTTKPPVEAEVAPACAAAVEAAARMLASHGHQVAEIDPGWTRDWLGEEFRRVWAAGISAQVLGLPVGPSGKPAIEAHIEALASLGAEISSGELLMSEARLQRHAREVAALWRDFDVIMTPTLASPPLRLGELFEGSVANPLEPMARADRFTPFTPLFNVTGQPALSAPTSWAGGIPIGVQLAAGPYREDLLLRLSIQLEHSTRWFSRRPPARSWNQSP
ncbi:MAG: amidase [Candidatus Dormibacteria bacterium]